jgi:hypothetical protein
MLKKILENKLEEQNKKIEYYENKIKMINEERNEVISEINKLD